MTRPTDDVPGLQELVSRQLLRWQSQARRQEEDRREEGGPGGPYLTLSREPGAGGTELGRAIARELGWRIYDRALLERMAAESGLTPAHLARVEEGPHDSVREAIFLTLDRAYPGHHVYLKRLVAVASDLAAKGRVVLVGRGVHFLLPPAWGLRVRLVAPLETRVRRVAERESIPEEQARAWIVRTDRSQVELVRNLLHRDLTEVHAYDLVLNTGDLGLEAAREIVIAALRQKGCLRSELRQKGIGC